VASGTGEHVVYFARQFPGITWQPSDVSPPSLRSIAAWTAAEARPNVLPPLLLDVATDDWPLKRAKAIVCINMLHISPWAATWGLMRGASLVLGPGAPLYLYGPFRRADWPLEPSNRAFDLQLRGSNAEWGLRDLEDVTACAEEHGLKREAVVEMPANNLSVVFRRL
jgi:hypothetical protein